MSGCGVRPLAYGAEMAHQPSELVELELADGPTSGVTVGQIARLQTRMAEIAAQLEQLRGRVAGPRQEERGLRAPIAKPEAGPGAAGG